MSKLSFWDKLKILVNISKDSYWFIFLLILLIIIGYVFWTNNDRNEKKTKITYIVFTGIIAAIVLITCHPSLSSFFDYFVNHFFIAILFPNFAIYFALIIALNCIVWISLFRPNTSKIIKRVNIIVYLFMNYFLVLLLNVIDTKKLDVFNETAVYKSKQATALIELSSILFVVWILFLILYKVILIYIRKDYKEKVKKVVVRKKKLPEFFVPVDTPDYLMGNIPKKNKELESMEKALTLEDYKLLIKILKEEKSKKKNNSKEEEKQRIQEMKKKEALREQEKYTELELLYRNIK